MVTSKVIALTLSLPLLSASLAIRQSGGDITTLTTLEYHDCSVNYTNILQQAQKDALQLAEAVFYECKDELTIGGAHKCIDWESQAVAEYFGPCDKVYGQRQRIFDTFVRATETQRYWFSDWWKDRYVDVWCSDKGKACRSDSPAYTVNDPQNERYPYIVYCPAFFDILDDQYVAQGTTCLILPLRMSLTHRFLVKHWQKILKKMHAGKRS